MYGPNSASFLNCLECYRSMVSESSASSSLSPHSVPGHHRDVSFVEVVSERLPCLLNLLDDVVASVDTGFVMNNVVI